jgi:hypothetical protein
MSTRASIATRLKKIEQQLNPEPVIHIFQFVGFDGHNPSTSRTETRGPKGERLVYLGFETVPPEPTPDTPAPDITPVKSSRRTRQRARQTPTW